MKVQAARLARTICSLYVFYVFSGTSHIGHDCLAAGDPTLPHPADTQVSYAGITRGLVGVAVAAIIPAHMPALRHADDDGVDTLLMTATAAAC